ncbi:MAG: SdrD B-like domain-containing protein [Microthrixaceae bacterium]
MSTSRFVRRRPQAAFFSVLALLVSVLSLSSGGVATAASGGVPPAISGVMFRDANADGLRGPDEAPMAGVVVSLVDGSTGAAVNPPAPVTTGPDGRYLFESLNPGAYRVKAQAPTNFLVDDDVTADNDLVVNPTNEEQGQTEPIVLDAGADIENVDGAIRPRPELDLGPFGPGVLTGAAPFDTDGNCAGTSPGDDFADPGHSPGDDCGPGNDAVRTQQQVQYVWSVTADNFAPGADDLSNVVFEQTLLPTPGDPLPAVVDFSRVPVRCTPAAGGGTAPASKIEKNVPVAGAVRLTCNLGAFSEGAQVSFSTFADVSGKSANGSSFSSEQRVYAVDSSGDENAVRDAEPPVGPTFVSAAPRYDLFKGFFRNSDVAVRDVGQGAEPGYHTYFNIRVQTDRRAGVEALEATAANPITLTDNITATRNNPSGAGQVDYTRADGFEYYITDCQPNPSGWSDMVYGYSHSSFPAGAQIKNSGSCAYSRTDANDPTSKYNFTLTGADFSGLDYPTRTIGGADLSAGPYIAIEQRVQVFIPFRAIEPTDDNNSNGVGALKLSNEFTGFDPSSASGTSNYGAGFEPGWDGTQTVPMDNGNRSNNVVGPTTYELRVAGSWSKYTRDAANILGTGLPYFPDQASYHSGDASVEPGRTYVGYVPFTNNGTSPLTNPMVCDVFDNTTQRLTTQDAPGVVYSGTPTAGVHAWMGTYDLAGFNADDYQIEYASMDFGPDTPISTGSVNPGTGRYDGNWDVARAFRCDDDATATVGGSTYGLRTPTAGDSGGGDDIAGDKWVSDPADVPGGIDGVNAVRARLKDPSTKALQPGQSIRFLVPLEARDLFHGGPRDGTEVPAATVLPDFGSVRSDQWGPTWTVRNYEASPESTHTDGDRVTLVRTQLRIEKNTVEPATNVGQAGSTVAGNNIVWHLNPVAQSTLAEPSPAKNTRVVDVLPPQATYDAACTTALANGTPPDLVEPDKDFNGNATGYTRLTWFFGDVQPNHADPNRDLRELYFCTNTDALAPDGTAVVNRSQVRADNVPTSASTQDDDHTITLEQTGSIQLSKKVDRTLDNRNEDQHYTLSWANFAASFTIDKPTIIDVFSYDDDAADRHDGFGSLSSRDPESDFHGAFTLDAAPTVTWLDGSTAGSGDPSPTLGHWEYTADPPWTVDYNPDVNTSKWCTESGGSFLPVAGPPTGCPGSFEDVTAVKFVSNYDLATDGNPRQGMKVDYTMNAGDPGDPSGPESNAAGDLYTNRFTLDSTSLPPEQFLRSNNVSVRVAAYAIGDLAFADVNGDGKYDAADGDHGVPGGVRVELYDASGDQVESTTTDANGRWFFDKLSSGDYTVKIPASMFASGGPLEGWTRSTSPKAPNDDKNEDTDHSTFADSVEQGAVSTHTVTLSATPPGPGEQPKGDEPLGDNVTGKPLVAGDDFSNLTVDLALVPPAKIGIVTQACTQADLSTCDENNDAHWGETTRVPEGTDVPWRITVTNTGGSTLTNVAVTDALVASCGDPAIGTLKPGESHVITCQSDDVTDDLTNLAKVTGTTTTGGTVRAEDPASVETYIPPGSLGDFIWNDLNGDGIQDKGEAGVEGATVALLNSVGQVVATQLTEADGAYLFENLAPGKYRIVVTPPAGYELSPRAQGGDIARDSDVSPTSGSSAVVTLAPGEDRTDLDAGMFQAVSVGDRIWTDLNGDGTQNFGETGIQGVTVELLDATGKVIDSDVTDSNGNYLFEHLVAGGYTVRVNDATLPSGLTQTFDPDTTVDGTHTRTIGAGTNPRDVDFGYIPVGDIDITKVNTTGPVIEDGGSVSYDIIVTNTGPTTLSDVTVTDKLAPGCARSLGTLPSGQTTRYSCTVNNVKKGFVNTASVEGTPPAGPKVDDTDDEEVKVTSIDLVKTATNSPIPKGGEATFEISVTNTGDVELTNLELIDVLAPDCDRTFATLGVGANETFECSLADVGDDFTNVATVMAETADGPNVADTDDAAVKVLIPGIAIDKEVCALPGGCEADGAGWAENASLASGSDVAWRLTVTNTGELDLAEVTITDALAADCDAAIGDLAKGDHQVLTCTSGAVTEGFTNTAKVSGKGPVGPPVTDQDTAAVGTFIPPASLGDRVWNDVNGNGILDPGESGVKGITVVLTDLLGNPLDTTVTDDDGFYSFTDLTPGTYRVEFRDLPEGFSFTLAKQGGDAAVDSDANVDTGRAGPITLAPAEDRTDVDAGIIAYGSIGDKVWLDRDGDGIQDDGEPGLSDITVKLLNAAGDEVDSTLTGANGGYRFDGLVPGEYTVVFSGLPGDHRLAPHGSGSDDAVDSDADRETGRTAPITLGPGEQRADIDAGVVPLGSIGDRVWTDLNGDGVQSPGEPGLDGITVKLFNAAGDEVGTTTTDHGAYLFEGLDPGEYTVRIITDSLPSGHTQTGDPDDETNHETTVKLGSDEDHDTADFGYIPAGSIDITKVNATGAIVKPGTDVTYEIMVTNTGPITLTNVTVTDPLVAKCDKGIGTLAAGQQHSYTCTAAGVDPGFINTADVAGTPPVGEPVTDTDDEEVKVASVSIDKSTEDSPVAAGGPVKFTIVVTNTGDVALNDVKVADPLAEACDVAVDSLGVGEQHTYDCTMDAPEADFVNVATVTADPEPIPGGGEPPQVTDTDDAPVDVLRPGIDITKQVCEDPEGCDAAEAEGWVETTTVKPGSRVVWRIVVTNTGETPLTDVVVNDPKVGDCDTEVGDLAPQESATVTCSTRELDDSLVNVATAVGTPPFGENVTAEDDATANAGPELSITKTVEADEVTAGDTIRYTLKVANAGPGDATDVVITDTLGAGLRYEAQVAPEGSPDRYDPDTNTVTWKLAKLAAGEDTSITYEVSVVETEAGKQLVNNASVKAAQAEATVSNNTDERSVLTVDPPDDSPDPLEPGAPDTSGGSSGGANGQATGSGVPDRLPQADTVPSQPRGEASLPTRLSATGATLAPYLALAFGLVLMGFGLKRSSRRRRR